MEAKELLETVVRAADDKKALGIVALDVANVSGIADYFVIMEAMNSRQLNAVVEAIDDAVSVKNNTFFKREGVPESGWVLLDIGDVVVSVFDHETRQHFNLEKLWSDAPLVNLSSWIEA